MSNFLAKLLRFLQNPEISITFLMQWTTSFTEKKIRNGRNKKAAYRRYGRINDCDGFFLFGLVFIIIGLFSNKGILQRIRLEKEKQAWKEKIETVEKEQERLKKEL